MKRLAILAAFSMAGPAVAQDCRNEPDLMQKVERGLKAGAGEVHAMTLLSWRGTVLRIFVNAETGTWTMIELHPNGDICVLDYGTALEVAPLKGDL